MGWKPSKDFPLIMDDLKKRGVRKEVTLSNLRLSVIEVLGYLTEKPLINIIKLLEDYGYLKQTNFVNMWHIVDKKATQSEGRNCDKIIDDHITGIPIIGED
jgi:hypothetical protein